MEMPDIPDSIMTITCSQSRDAVRFFNGRFRAAKAPINATQYDMLRKIWIFGGSFTLTDASNSMCMDRSTFGRNVLNLQRGGYVSTSIPVDCRAKVPHLTELGKKIVLKYSDLYRLADKDYCKSVRIDSIKPSL